MHTKVTFQLRPDCITKDVREAAKGSNIDALTELLSKEVTADKDNQEDYRKAEFDFRYVNIIDANIKPGPMADNIVMEIEEDYSKGRPYVRFSLFRFLSLNSLFLRAVLFVEHAAFASDSQTEITYHQSRGRRPRA